MTASKRLQFDISGPSFEKLKKLKEETDASSYGEVTSRAYKIYDYIHSAMGEGKQFIVRDKDGNETIVEFV